MQDKDLIRAAKFGDKAVLSVLVEKYYDEVYSFLFRRLNGSSAAEEESNLERLFTTIPFILLGSYLICLMTLAVSAFCKKQITSIVLSCFICLIPFAGECIYIDNVYLSQLLEIMPVNMVFGSYISNSAYFYIQGEFFDLRLFFPIVAIAVVAICLPLIFKKYCSHQVSN